MRVLVLGGAGMLGHKVVQQLARNGSEVWWTLRAGVDDPALDPVPVLRGSHAIQHVDALDAAALDHAVQDLRPDAVVNCLGVIKQERDGSDPIVATAINAVLPHRLARLVQPWGGRFIQISTDCVFSGSRGNYTEADEPDADDVYGRSKAEGEVVADNALTLRTSIIGRQLRHHRSLLDWFLSQRGKHIRGYRHAIWSGVTTIHLAELIDTLLHKHGGLAGIHHVSSGRISKFDLLQALKSGYDLDVAIEPDDSVQCDRSLVGRSFERATGYRCPPMSELIAQLVSDPTPYPDLS